MSLTPSSPHHGVTPPSQRRSRETFDRILSATEELLDGRDYSEISIIEICAQADVSASSFYARFASKDTLLTVLHEQHLAANREKLDEAADLYAQADLPLRQMVELGLTAYYQAHSDDKPLMATFRRAEVTDPVLADRRLRFDSYGTGLVIEVLCDRVPDPDEALKQRIAFATRAASAVVRDFVRNPTLFARDFGTAEDMVAQATEMWMRYVFDGGVPPDEAGPTA